MITYTIDAYVGARFRGRTAVEAAGLLFFVVAERFLEMALPPKRGDR